jgi:hypothetical protein
LENFFACGTKKFEETINHLNIELKIKWRNAILEEMMDKKVYEVTKKSDVSIIKGFKRHATVIFVRGWYSAVTVHGIDFQESFAPVKRKSLTLKTPFCTEIQRNNLHGDSKGNES